MATSIAAGRNSRDKALIGCERPFKTSASKPSTSILQKNRKTMDGDEPVQGSRLDLDRRLPGDIFKAITTSNLIDPLVGERRDRRVGGIDMH